MRPEPGLTAPRGGGDGKGRARREGWRRALHVASGCLGPLAARVGPAVATPVFGAIVTLAAASEGARLASPRARAALGRIAGSLFRPEEERGVSGATTLAVGYALTWWIFPVPVAERAIVVAAVADPVAALVGSFAGGGAAKSWQGSLACACAAAAVLVPFHVTAGSIGVVAIAAAVAERAPWRGSDNIALPLVVASLLAWMA